MPFCSCHSSTASQQSRLSHHHLFGGTGYRHLAYSTLSPAYHIYSDFSFRRVIFCTVTFSAIDPGQDDLSCWLSSNTRFSAFITVLGQTFAIQCNYQCFKSILVTFALLGPHHLELYEGPAQSRHFWRSSCYRIGTARMPHLSSGWSFQL